MRSACRAPWPPKGIATLLDHLSPLEDRRVTGRCLYSLQTVVVIGLLGVLCGAEGWLDRETFARSKQDWLRGFLDLPLEPPTEGGSSAASSLPSGLPSSRQRFRALAPTLARELGGQVVAFDRNVSADARAVAGPAGDAGAGARRAGSTGGADLAAGRSHAAENRTTAVGTRAGGPSRAETFGEAVGDLRAGTGVEEHAAVTRHTPAPAHRVAGARADAEGGCSVDGDRATAARAVGVRAAEVATDL